MTYLKDVSYKSISGSDLEQLPSLVNDRKCRSCKPSKHSQKKSTLYDSYDWEYYSSGKEVKGFCEDVYEAEEVLKCEQNVPGVRWCGEEDWSRNGKVCTMMSRADSWTYRAISSSTLNPYSTPVTLYVNLTSYPTYLIIWSLLVLPLFFMLMAYMKFLKIKKEEEVVLLVSKNSQIWENLENPRVPSPTTSQESSSERKKERRTRRKVNVMSYEDMENKVKYYMPF